MDLAGLTPEDSSPGRALTTAIISSWRDIGLKEWPEIRHGYGLIIPRPHQVLINMNESPFPDECTATIVPYSILLRFFSQCDTGIGYRTIHFCGESVQIRR